uniref:Uterine-secreted microprotein 2 n=2 Tax=Notamacropus eugenii TaxID=9315 RepID=H2CYD6_NOTEU|nr:uterine-secreted microprotein 2 [Notamacropus eugenii]
MERLISLMLLSTVLALAHGYCYRVQLRRISQFGPRNMCMDEVNNKMYKMGSKWQNSRCETCLCTNIGMMCCETWGECH